MKEHSLEILYRAHFKHRQKGDKEMIEVGIRCEPLFLHENERDAINVTSNTARPPPGARAQGFATLRAYLSVNPVPFFRLEVAAAVPVILHG